MALSGDQIRKLHYAILCGFRADDLEQLLRFDLNERLDNIVPTGRELSSVVFELIQWAERSGRADELIQAIRRARPNNKEVQKFAREFCSPPAEDRPRAGPAPLDGPRRARLREALLNQFPTRTDLRMLVDDALSVNLDRFTPSGSLTEAVFDLIQWAATDPQGQLQPLLTEAVRQRPQSAELKALKAELFGE
jgi:hypothetical protein